MSHSAKTGPDTSGHSGPPVSVVMPAFDSGRYIDVAVRSVERQTWPDIELIVVDDGSRDDTAARLADLQREWVTPGRRLRVVSQPNRGAAAARNAGIALARAPLIALFDADDIHHPDLVTALVSRLDASPELDLAFALYRYVDADGRVTAAQPAPAAPRLGTRDILADNIVHAPMIRAAALRAVGPLDETLTAHIDLDLFTRLTERRADCIGVVPEVLSDYRRHGTQITRDWRRMRRNWHAVHDKLCAGGLDLTRAQHRHILARLNLYWSTLAYQSGDHGEARRLIRAAWRNDPAGIARDPHGRIRTAACVATLLPRAAHDRIRRRFNAGTPT